MSTYAVVVYDKFDGDFTNLLDYENGGGKTCIYSCVGDAINDIVYIMNKELDIVETTQIDVDRYETRRLVDDDITLLRKFGPNSVYVCDFYSDLQFVIIEIPDCADRPRVE